MADKEDGGPQMIVFAGPNGSGKSTINKQFLARNPGMVYVNADDIAKQLEKNLLYKHVRPLRELEAARQADQQRKDAVASKTTFAFETVMSTPGNLALITQAKANDYNVNVLFVTLADPSINIERVKQRVADKGHPVPENKIVDRWHRTMQLMPSVMLAADTGMVFDNSDIANRHVPVAEKKDGVLTLTDAGKKTPWVVERLEKPYKELEHHQKHISKVVGDRLPGVAIEHANAGEGQQYTGQVIAVNKAFIAQRTADSKVVLHSRALYQANGIAEGKTGTIGYHYEGGKFKKPSNALGVQAAPPKAPDERGRGRS